MNNTSTASASDAVRNRRLLILGALLILAAIAITAGRLIHSRMQQARLMQDRPKDLRWGTYVYSPATAAKAQTQRQKYLAKANLLRDHWRVWAVAHQDSLRQIRHAPPGDIDTLMHFYMALPITSGLNQSTGITLQDIGVSPEDANSGRAILFAWERHPPKPIVAAWARKYPDLFSGAQEVGPNTDDTFFEHIMRYHAKYHDVPVCESMTAGRGQITLWADGRLTEMIQGDLHPGERRGEGQEKEIAPPYDLLK